MSLKFKCKKCGGNIIVQYLKKGEEAQCKNCKVINIIPEDAIVTDEKPLKILPKAKESTQTPETSNKHTPGKFGYSLAKTLWEFALAFVVLWGVIALLITIFEDNPGVSTYTLPIKIEFSQGSLLNNVLYEGVNQETFMITGFTRSKVAIKSTAMEYLDIVTHTFYAAIFLWIAYHLRCLFNSVKQCKPFTQDNTKRIRIIGYTIVFSELLRWLWFFCITSVCCSYLNIQICGLCNNLVDDNLLFEFLRSDLRFEWIFVGMVVVAIAEIIGMGVRLQQESELTI